MKNCCWPPWRYSWRTREQNFDYLRFQVYQTINRAKVNVSMSDINVWLRVLQNTSWGFHGEPENDAFRKQNLDYFRFQVYLNNRVFLSRNYRLIVAPRKFDVLKTNICPRSEASRANMLVLRTSNFQGATIRPIVPRHKHSIVFIVHH